MVGGAGKIAEGPGGAGGGGGGAAVKAVAAAGQAGLPCPASTTRSASISAREGEAARYTTTITMALRPGSGLPRGG